MRILLDNNVTQKLAPFLAIHEVVPARQKGWDEIENGDLISAAEDDGFDVLITADKGTLYQQNMTGRRISIILLRAYRITIRHLQPLVPELLKTLEDLPQGVFVVISSNTESR